MATLSYPSFVKEGASIVRANSAYPVVGGALKLAKDVWKGATTPGGVFGPPAAANAAGLSYDTGGGSAPQNDSPVNYNPQPIDTPSGGGNVSLDSVGSGGGRVSASTSADLEQAKQMNLAAISDQYDSEISRLRAMEKNTKSLYGNSISQAQQYYPQFQSQVQAQSASTDKQLGDMGVARQQQADQAMNQSKQLLNDLNRRQAAYMSATGTYGTAVPEAFGQQFSNKAYAALNQIQQSRDQAMTEIQNKQVASKQFFDQKLLEGKQQYDQLLANLEAQKNAALDQISSAKGQASSAKSAGIIDVWNQYTNNKFQLDQSLLNYQQQVAQYASQQNNTLQSIPTEAPASNWGAPGIDSSNNGRILDTFNQIVASSGGNTNSGQNYAPVYTKRNLSGLTPEQLMAMGVDPATVSQNPTSLQLSNIG